jgi:hypothetical protein
LVAKNTPIREGKKIVFGDGKQREIFPVSIKNMRKMMKVMSGIDQTTNEMDNDTIDTLLAAARIVLETVDPKLVAASKVADEKREKLLAEGNEDGADEVEDPLEDILDIKTIQEVLSAGMGTDPNF